MASNGNDDNQRTLTLGEKKMSEPVSEDTISAVRKLFGSRLSGEIEKWTLGVGNPQATLATLTGPDLAKRIGCLIDIFAAKDLDDQEPQDVVDRLTIQGNEAIVAAIKTL